MTNLCTKVTVRKRPIKNGQTSLYLDFILLLHLSIFGCPTLPNMGGLDFKRLQRYVLCLGCA